MIERREVRPATLLAVACLGIAVFSCMDAVMKGQSIAIGAFSALLWRSAIATAASGLMFVGLRRRWPRRSALGLHLVRSLMTTASVLLFFWGLARTPMAQAVALTFLSPLIATLLAALTLGERVRPNALGGSVLAFAGVLLIVATRAGTTQGPEALMGAGAILLASLFYAATLVLLRHQAQAADPVEITFMTNLVMLVALLPAAPFVGSVPLSGGLPLLAVAAGLALISSLLLAWAYARGQAQVIAPVEYTAFVWSALLGALVFGETLIAATVAGAAMIVGGCVFAARGRAGGPVVQTEAAL